MATGDPLYDLFASFEQVRALVIGDLMLDHYYYGRVDRISPEAPIPLLDVERREDRLGGAGNVVANLYFMGVQTDIVSVIGDDVAGQRLLNRLKEYQIDVSGIVLDQSRPTTQKNRIFSQNRQIFRFDEETRQPINDKLEIALINAFEETIERNRPDVIVLQDYDKGVLTPNVIRQVLDMADERGIPTAVDPKHDNFFTYKGCTLFKPNLKEAKQGLNIPILATSRESLDTAAGMIEHQLNNQVTVITLADKGIYMKTEEGSEINPSPAHDVYDVCGAGDSVMAMLAVGLAKPEVELYNFLDFANLAAAQVCRKVGVATIDLQALYKEVRRLMEAQRAES